MRKILTLVALVASVNAMSQSIFTPGYVITAKGDTIKGEIKHNPKKEFDLFSKVTVKIAENQNKTLKADKVKMYAFGDNTYISMPGLLEGEPGFVKMISKGAITLYEFQTEWVNSKNESEYRSEYYVLKNGDTEPVKIKSSKFRKQVAEIIADNEELVKELEEKKYEYENLAEVVESYNKWAKQKS